MFDRISIRRMRALGAPLLLLLISALLAACGSSSSNQAKTLLDQTFTGTHTVNSGNLSFSLTLTPSGSATLRSPISLSFGGPFQSLGAGRLPKSNFNISFNSSGKTGSVGIISTGATGYVTLQGVGYQLPQATFTRLESSFQGLSSTPGASTGSGALSKLGIHPLNWLSNPAVVGKEAVGGTDTTHIRATINVASLLADLNTFLQKASSLGVSGANKIPTSLPASTRQRIASEVQNPSFDVWTGNSDKTVRKLAIGLTLPVGGQISSLLGGLKSAALGLRMQYANLNQPQTITAPTNLRPFSEFTTKLRTFLSAVQGGLGAAATGGATGSTASTGSAAGTTATSSTTSPTGASSAVQRYSQCIVQAHNDVTKMQRCASLINGQ